MRAYLADAMRLGKTVQTGRAAKLLGLRNVLTVCPAGAVPGWYDEWPKWGPSICNFAAISYDSLIRRTDVVGSDWDLVVLDEAHYVKTPGAKRTKAALK